MSDDEKPAPVWLFHKASGQVQQVSAAAWAAHQATYTEPERIEGPLHGWQLATEEQAAMGEAIKAARLAESAPAPAVEPEQSPARRR